MSRAPGTVVLDKRTGRYRVRVRATGPDGERVRVWISGPARNGYATREEAERARRAATLVRDTEMRGGRIAPADSVREWGELVLDRRAIDGLRNVRSERSCWKCHCLTAPFIDYPIGAVQRGHVRDWLRALASAPRHASHNQRAKDAPPARATVRNAKALLSAIFAVAVEEEVISENPCYGVRVPGRPAAIRAIYLAPADVRAWAACEAIPETERCVGLVLAGTGLRLGELVWMPARNVALEGESPSAVVEFGSTDAGTRERLSPKSKRFRRVPIFGIALWAWRRFRALTSAWPNPEGLAFPREDGTPRAIARSGRAEFRRWETYRAAAGLRPEVRVHDLRHTCASLLLTGAMSELLGEPVRRWTLLEIRDLLGHSSVKVTERYAHLAPNSLEHAARETGGGGGGPGVAGVGRRGLLEQTGLLAQTTSPRASGLPLVHGRGYTGGMGLGRVGAIRAEKRDEVRGTRVELVRLAAAEPKPAGGLETTEENGAPWTAEDLPALAAALFAALAAGDVDQAAELATALVVLEGACSLQASHPREIGAALAAARALLGVA